MDGYEYPSEWPSAKRQKGGEYQGQPERDGPGPNSRSGVPLASSHPPHGSFWPNPSNVGTPGTSARDPAAMPYQQPGWSRPTQSATPYHAGNVLPRSNGPIPERALRIVSGGSIIEEDSVVDEESGMTYRDHPTARYPFPNDPAEQDRADMQHKIFRMYNGGALHTAPVGSPRNVLEIASGTGLWAIQYATEHPECKIVGTDISSIQPSTIPDNCSFVREDSEHDEWIFQEPFGFIFMRLVSYNFDDYPTVFRKCFDNLEPGGWMELNDATFELVSEDGSMSGTSIEKWCQRMSQALVSMGRDPNPPQNYKRWMEEIGFVDVVEHISFLPVNPWPEDQRLRELGQWQMTSFYRGLRGFSYKLLRDLGMPRREVEELISLAREDLRNTRLHFSLPIYIVYGRKPYQWETAQRSASASGQIPT